MYTMQGFVLIALGLTQIIFSAIIWKEWCKLKALHKKLLSHIGIELHELEEMHMHLDDRYHELTRHMPPVKPTKAPIVDLLSYRDL